MSAGNIITHLCNDVTILEGKNTNTFTLDGEWRYSQKKVDALIANNETISISQFLSDPITSNKAARLKRCTTY